MRRGDGTIVIVGASVFYAVASFYRLWTRGFHRDFVRLLAVSVAWGAFMAFGFWWSWSIHDPQQRVWVVIPFVMQIPIVLVGGFALYRSAERILDPQRFPPRKPPDSRRRLFGAMLTLIACGIWVYGLFQPIRGSGTILLVVVMLYSGLFGVPYLLTGRRINDLD